MLVALDGGVLGGQAEGVPADRVQDVVALLEPVARDDVGQREGLGVAHVQVARRVGEHVQQVATLGAVVVAALNGSSSAQTFSHLSWVASMSYVAVSSVGTDAGHS